MKRIFLGTPQVAAEVCEYLIKHNIFFDAIITSPDKPVGRKQIITPSPTKIIALKYGVKIFQPKTKDELDVIISNINPDYAFVVAYGMIIKKETLIKAKIGFFNLHFSLLPAYRGADPIRWAILNGEEETGITIFKIEEGIDTGPILIQEKIKIDKNETAKELLTKLTILGKDAMYKVVKIIESGGMILTEQKGIPSYAPKISLKDTFLNFSLPWINVYNKIRAFSYEPYARFIFKYKQSKVQIQILSAVGINDNYVDFSPGQICGFESKKGILVKCLKGSVCILRIKPEGKKEMNAYDYFINGMKLKIGDYII
ncbi:MAG: methionyl-tRNA formyltransferase [Elusimicrobiales bacterium]|nr:methionyl-tRNA formyltransferase [Elusimicrobiales bacterium]